MLNKEVLLKAVSIVMIIIVILNLVLFALRMINGLAFWIIMIVYGFCAYYLMPRIK
jgi:hypothetical protein